MARLLFSLALFCALFAFIVPARAVQPMKYLDVRDYGATPDKNDDDDGPAIQKAVDAACEGKDACRAVYFPRGEYRVATTIKLEMKHLSLLISGVGMRTPHIYPTPTPELYGITLITWDGPAGGVMFDCVGVMGLRMSDIALHGDYRQYQKEAPANGRAGVLVKVNSILGAGAGEFFFERVGLWNADTGFECGREKKGCSSDMTFIDLCIGHCRYGFHTIEDQNVNYIFIRPEIGQSMNPGGKLDDCIGFFFAKGGVVNMYQLSAAWIEGTLVKVGVEGVGGGEAGSGMVNFDTIKLETQKNGDEKRPIVLDVTGWGPNISITNLSYSQHDIASHDRATPIFKLGWLSQVTVRDSSMMGYNYAQITGSEANGPSWLQFENCRFGYGDPTKGITHDRFSGYGMRNCTYGKRFFADFREGPEAFKE